MFSFENLRVSNFIIHDKIIHFWHDRKELSFFCHKLRFSNPYIFATRFRWSLIFQTMNSVWSNSRSLKYQRFTRSGCKDIGIRKFEIVAKTQFLSWCFMFAYVEVKIKEFNFLSLIRKFNILTWFYKLWTNYQSFFFFILTWNPTPDSCWRLFVQKFLIFGR